MSTTRHKPVSTVARKGTDPKSYLWFSCDSCLKWLRVPVANSGGRCKCRHCSKPLRIPSGVSTGEAPPSAFDSNIHFRNLTQSPGYFRFLCPKCKRKFKLPSRMAGTFVACPKCRTICVARSYREIAKEGVPQLRGASAVVIIDQCSAEVTAPSPVCAEPLVEAVPVAPPAGGRVEEEAEQSIEEICAICQCPIESEDEHCECSECALPFHQGCWEENFGCAAYGCQMVDCLKKGADLSIAAEGLPAASRVQPPPLPTTDYGQAEEPSLFGVQQPWEHLLLGGSVFAGLLSLVSYGVPSFLVGAFTVYFLKWGKGKKRIKILAFCQLICLVGFIIGLSFA